MCATDGLGWRVGERLHSGIWRKAHMILVMDPEDPIEAFDKDQAARGLLPNTRGLRRRQLDRLRCERGPFEMLTPDVIADWLDGRHVSAKTRSTYLSTFSNFYDWGVRDRRYRSNPIVELERPRVHEHMPRGVDSAKLRAAIDASSGTMRCWLMLVAFEGLTCQEVAFLEWENIDIDRSELVVANAKSKSHRRIPLRLDVLESIEKAVPGPRRGRLFPDAKPQNVSQRLDRHLHRNGLKETARNVRHRFAMEIYDQRKDIKLVQTLLGHTSITTTANYARFDRDAAASAVNELTL